MIRRLAFCLFVITLAAGSVSQAAERVVPQSRSEVLLSYAPVVKTVSPAVVNIYTRRVVQSRPLSPFLDDPFFRRFFGENSPFGRPQKRVENSLGSGVIVSSEGIIVTNHHVIEGSDEITVALSDRREFPAEVLGTDERADLAVLKIDAGSTPLPSITLGDSDSIQVGDLVLAVGNPFGVGQTVTSGIVSAVARTMTGVSDFESFIQTDAAINPGNSGGALVTLDGKLIGINTAIFSRSGGSVGIGFAIPSNLVASVVAGITDGGKVVRPWLGADGQAVTSELADSMGLDRPVGVVVNDVYPKGPAHSAGLQVGDVVTAVDGREIYDPQGLRYRIGMHKAEGTAELTILREGRERRLTVALMAPPEMPPRDVRDVRGRNPLSGARVANLSPAFAEEIGFDPMETGVVVLEVQGGLAARLGLRPGDIIQSINDSQVTDTARLERLLDQPALSHLRPRTAVKCTQF